MSFPRTTAALREALAAVGIHPKKQHGQNFLTDVQAIDAIVRDAEGNELAESPVLYFSRARRQLEVNPAGFVQAHGPGVFEIIALAPGDPDASFFSAQEAPRATITVT